MTSASRYAAFAQRSFQRDLDGKARTMHREHISWCGNEILGEKVDSGLYTIRQLWAGKMQATYNLQPQMGSYMLKTSSLKVTSETYHVYRPRESLNGILDNIHDARVGATKLSMAISLGSAKQIKVTQRAKYHKSLPKHIYDGISLIHNILDHS